VVVRAPASAAERERATDIVERYGRSSLAAMTLLRDKSYWFSPGGSVIAYVVSGGVAAVLGDPIGPDEDLAGAVREFAGYAAERGWIPTFYETDHRDEPGYTALGFSALCLGHEAIVSVRDFTLSGKSFKSVRNRMNHLEQEGYAAELLPAPQTAAALRALRDVSDVWLAKVGGSEKRFSLGWFDDRYVRECDVMVVREPHGAIVAFANIVSEYRADDLTIDMMRHSPEAPAGVMDFLFVRLFELARDRGFSGFNMGLSPLAGLGSDPSAGITERVLAFVYEHGNALYGFRGLHEYKNKFGPAWEPRYLIYPDAASLPAVLAAVVRVNSGPGAVKGYAERALTALRRPEGAS
jgi:phosphatidylglycerol lysyltransferase